MRAALRLAGLATVCLASAGCPGVPDLRFDDSANSSEGGPAAQIDATTGVSGDAAGADAGGPGDLPDVADAPEAAPSDSDSPEASSPPDAAPDGAAATCPTTAPPGTLCCGKTVCVGNKGQCGDCTACHLCDLEGFCCPAKVTCATSVDGCAK